MAITTEANGKSKNAGAADETASSLPGKPTENAVEDHGVPAIDMQRLPGPEQTFRGAGMAGCSGPGG